MKKKAQRKVFDSITEHPFWKEIKPFVRFEIYRREGGGSRNPRFRIGLSNSITHELACEALLVKIGCATCGDSISPFRFRDKGRKNIYFAATCPLRVSIGCSRSSKASEEYKKIYEQRSQV